MVKLWWCQDTAPLLLEVERFPSSPPLAPVDQCWKVNVTAAGFMSNQISSIMGKCCEGEGISIISIWACTQHRYTCLSYGRLLEILSYGNRVVMVVSTVATSQIKYATSFYWRSGMGDIFVICFDSEDREASLLNTMCQGLLKSICFSQAPNSALQGLNMQSITIFPALGTVGNIIECI